MYANSLGVDTWLRGSITNQENVFHTTNLFLVSNAQGGEIISEGSIPNFKVKKLLQYELLIQQVLKMKITFVFL